MKVRKDFVTNSSSSSFIISRDAVSYNKLIAILLEIANLEAEQWREEDEDEDDEKYTMEDVGYNQVTHRYVIIECTHEEPYVVENWFSYLDKTDTIYDNHFLIGNNCCIRYNWDVIEEVLNKYNIPWNYGYCD